MKPLPTLLFCASALLSSSFPAQAGEGVFGRTYTTDTIPKGQFEFEQGVRSRSGRAFGTYQAFDFITELEYGITDNLQAALYFNTGHIHAKGSPDDDDVNGVTGFSRNKLMVENVAVEFVYRVLSPYKDGIGLAFYFEPEFRFNDQHNGLAFDHSFGFEYRAILQKNFFDDRLIVAYNLGFETEWIRFKGEKDFAGELDWNNELGVSYRFVDNFYFGWEFRNHNEYGDFKVHEHSLYWTGPTIHYGGKKFWATLGALYQVAGNPGHDEDGNYIGGSRFLRSHELWEVSLKIGIPF
jgi:hypothetical protein